MTRTEIPSPSLPWPPPTPFALFVYDGDVTADLLRRLLHVHGPPIRHPNHGWRPGGDGQPAYEGGAPWSAAQVEERVQGVLEGRGWNLPIVPPGGPATGMGQDPPLFEIAGFDGLPMYHTDANGDDVPYGLFSPPLLPYLYLMATIHTGLPFDVRGQLASNRFMATAMAVARVLRAPFVAGDDMAAFPGPMRDPRGRAWGVTYYGPDLVQQIGHARLASAPAWKVQADSDLGGMWVVLDELPFVESDQRAARQEAVMEHLGLSELFPS